MNYFNQKVLLKIPCDTKSILFENIIDFSIHF